MKWNWIETEIRVIDWKNCFCLISVQNIWNKTLKQTCRRQIVYISRDFAAIWLADDLQFAWNRLKQFQDLHIYECIGNYANERETTLTETSFMLFRFKCMLKWNWNKTETAVFLLYVPLNVVILYFSSRVLTLSRIYIFRNLYNRCTPSSSFRPSYRS